MFIENLGYLIVTVLTTGILIWAVVHAIKASGEVKSGSKKMERTLALPLFLLPSALLYLVVRSTLSRLIFEELLILVWTVVVSLTAVGLIEFLCFVSGKSLQSSLRQASRYHTIPWFFLIFLLGYIGIVRAVGDGLYIGDFGLFGGVKYVLYLTKEQPELLIPGFYMHFGLPSAIVATYLGAYWDEPKEETTTENILKDTAGVYALTLVYSLLCTVGVTIMALLVFIGLQIVAIPIGLIYGVWEFSFGPGGDGWLSFCIGLVLVAIPVLIVAGNLVGPSTAATASGGWRIIAIIFGRK